MTVLRRAYGLELVRLTADEANDDRDVIVIRETGDTAETFSSYDEDEALARWWLDLRVRWLAGRVA